jgi:hypothetical protein
MSVRTIEHKLATATVWPGTAPAADAVLGNDMESHPEGVAGGLFDLGETKPMQIAQIMFKPGTGTTAWALVIVDIDAVEIPIAAGADDSPYVSTAHNGVAGADVILLEGQTLKLTSVTVPSTASRIRLSFSQQRD